MELMETLSRRVSIAHHVPGRIRLKFDPRIATEPIFGAFNPAKVPEWFERVEGIKSARINLLAFSCTLEYDPSVISVRVWHDLCEGIINEQSMKVANDMLRVYQQVTPA